MKPESRCAVEGCWARKRDGEVCTAHSASITHVIRPQRKKAKNWPDKEIKFLDQPRPRDHRREAWQEARLVASVGEMLRQQGKDEVEIGWRLSMVRERCRSGFDAVFQDGC